MKMSKKSCGRMFLVDLKKNKIHQIDWSIFNSFPSTFYFRFSKIQFKIQHLFLVKKKHTKMRRF